MKRIDPSQLRHLNLQPRGANRGFSLIEVMLSMTIISLFLVGMGVLQAQALNGSADSFQRSKATWLASELAERMRVNIDGVKAGHYLAYVNSSTLCDTPPTMVCRDYRSGSSSVDANECDAEALAKFDSWELSCGFNQADIKSDLIDFINNDEGSALTLTCDDADTTDAESCSEGSAFDIAVKWRAMSANIHNRGVSEHVVTLRVRP